MKTQKQQQTNQKHNSKKEKTKTKEEHKQQKHEKSSLPKKPAIYDTIYFYTKFLEMGYGIFEEKNWQNQSPITSDAFQTIFSGVKLHNKIQLEKTLKNLYLNANPVMSIVYLILLNEFIQINNTKPKFIDNKGNIILSELETNLLNGNTESNEKPNETNKEDEKEDEEMFERIVEKINVNKKMIYVDENEKEEQRK